MAAGNDEPVSFVHAVRGAKREWAKLGLLAFPLQSVIDQSASPPPEGG